jgi:hypothetical protein
MYGMAVHAYNLAHHHSALASWYTTLKWMKSPEDVMFGFEKWK